MAYLASIHKASAVRRAVKANFFSPDEPSLVVAKANRAEIYTLSAACLYLRTSFRVYGSINGLLTLRPSNSSTDHLFITTDHNDYFTVSWDRERDTIRNERTAQDVADRFLRDAPGGPRYIADPGGRMLGIHVYEGLFLAIPFVLAEKKGRRKTTSKGEIGNLDEHSTIRMKELMIIDIAFLYGTDIPVLAVLHRGGKPDTAQLSTYKVTKSGGACELQEWEIKSSSLEAAAKVLIPLPEPLGGVLVVGEQMVFYLPAPGEHSRAIKRPLVEPTVFQAWGMVDRQRYLLGDEVGKLKMLFLQLDEDDKIVDIKVETIGETSTANTLIYLDNGHVFVGSQHGDSQLVKLSPQEPKCQVIQSLTSLAPILDFQVVGASHSGTEDQQNQYTSGQTKIVSGCGGFSTGGLRSMRSGVGLKDSAILGDMDGVRGLWAVKIDAASEFDDILLVSFIDETRIFRFDPDGEVEELNNFKGFCLDEETLIAIVLAGEKLLQVTPARIKLIDAEGGTVLSEITTASKITAASANHERLVCNVENNSIVVYDVLHELKEIKSRKFEHEIACLYASPAFPEICTVGFWTVAAVSLLSLPGLETLTEVSLGGGTAGTIPRSAVVVQVLENQPPSLLVAMGDGTLYTFSVDDKKNYELSQKKAIALGTQAFYFQVIPGGNDTVSVFAACDHPSLIYSDDGRLVYSAVTAENVTNLTPFNAQAFPSSVVVLADGELKISNVDPARNIHVKTLSIGDVVRRVSYSRERQTYGIVTIRSSIEVSTGEERYTSYVRVVDDVEFAVIDSYKLREWELVESILCAQLDNGDGTKSQKFLVGTGFQPGIEDDDGDLECKEGRMLVFEFSEDRKLKLAAELKVKSAIKAIDMVGDQIVVALNKTVDIYSFTYPITPTKPELTKLTSYRCHSEPIDLGVLGNMISVGDLMKGPYIIEYTSFPSPKLTEVARTYQTLWSTAVDMMDKDTVINGDAEGNLSIWQRDDDALLVADQKRLRLIADMRIGEMINRIRRVDVQPLHMAHDALLQPAAYIATVEGSIYLLAKISEAKTQLLLQLQTNLAKVVVSVGELEFNRWRSFSTPSRVSEEPYRFVDGDFVGKFLTLPEDVAKKVCRGVDNDIYALGASVEEVRSLVESLKTFH
ncbi:DNA damage-binding protein 1 [Wilcoxina mikolae CBS 423.85]|nr:DNA damage-binding protein 1 [Wilcoxina mikolae CBS 423.85]